MRIWGRKITTEPTPPQTPSSSSPFSIESGRALPIQPPVTAISESTPSINGTASVKMLWNTAITTARKTSGPATGCRNTRSSLRPQADGSGEW